MPVTRPARASRVISNENDENRATTRITRAKTASQGNDELPGPLKATVHAKKSVLTSVNGAAKRSALGDVSNVNKVEGVEGKKPTVGKVALTSKATRPTRIEKSVARPTSRTAVSSSTVKKAVEVKRPGSGSGTLATSQKRKLQVASADAGVAAPKDEPKPKKIQSSEGEKAQDLSEKVQAHKKTRAERIFEALRKADEKETDPLMVAEYTEDIFDYLLEIEPNSMPNPDYMAHQDDIEWKTRGILIDWLIEVHTRFQLLPETLFLTVNIIDRFLSEKVVQLDRLQLVGITAMFIAAKYEEVLSPHVSNFKSITDNGFSETEILGAERFVLSTLNYDLSYPNPMNFLRRVSKADNYKIQTRTLGKYFIEISLLDHRFLEFRPSLVAAAAMYLARMMLDDGPWDEALCYYAGYPEDTVFPVAKLMVDYLARPPIHEAFLQKYAAKKFLKASILARQWAKQNAESLGIDDVSLSIDLI